MNDSDIIELFFMRSEQAVSELLHKYGSLCEKIISNILKNRSDEEECLNDTTMQIWNNIPPARPENLCGYVCKTARNIAINRFRTLKRQSSAECFCGELIDSLPSDRNVDTEIDGIELGKLINEFLGIIGRDERTVFVLRYYYGEDIKHISSSFECSQTKIRTILFRTRRKLAQFLREKGVSI